MDEWMWRKDGVVLVNIYSQISQMDNQNCTTQDAKLKRDEDAVAMLQDAVPQLDSLFVISHAIGHGTFSSVYFARTKHATTINGRKHFAVKHIIPTSHPSRVFMEVKCLKMIGGSDNVMGVTLCFREMNHIVIVMPYFAHDSFSDYVGSLTTSELQDYLKNLLIALCRVHHFKIIHRDVKPANFLYNRKHRRYSLVDFGLAQEVSSLNKIGGNQFPSPPTINTPHLTSNKTVKRKLATSQDETEYEKKKKSRHFSPSTSAAGSVLSSASSRVNTGLRRSPRKQCLIPLSPKKENLATPRKASNIFVLQDSPSKHTRSAEAGHRSGASKDHDTKIPSYCAKIKQEAAETVRRSPRKSVSLTMKGPLEGLAKYLQEATTAHAKTPSMRVEDYIGECTPSGDSSFVNRTLSLRQKQSQSLGCSPRVSGIGDSRSHSLEKANSCKNTRVLQEVQTKSGTVLKPVSCHCYGSARICSVCMGRSNQHAPRAGTPGFRAPEVLLRHPDQGTAVDMWSVGVILLCLLSGRYPFFRAVDDLSTLAEIATLIGTYSIRKAAAKYGKTFKFVHETFHLAGIIKRYCAGVMYWC
ncbi:Cell division control protein 7 [Halocaridina rubra]|uniref:non-specific serine/threonine protein kinase n=1 Tax=Halocaridina rubra TaxID=373956 RepID=A0AAN8XEU3_HALRR